MWLIPVLLIAALVVVGGGVGLFLLLRGGSAEDAAEAYVQNIFDGACEQAWALISPRA